MARKHPPLITQLDFLSELGLNAPTEPPQNLATTTEETALSATAAPPPDTLPLLHADAPFIENISAQITPIAPPESAVPQALATEAPVTLESPVVQATDEASEGATLSEEIDLPWHLEAPTEAISVAAVMVKPVENNSVTAPIIETISIASDADLPWFSEAETEAVALPINTPSPAIAPAPQPVFEEPPEEEELFDIFSAAEELPWEAEEMPPLPAPPVMELAAITQLLDDPLPVVRSAPPAPPEPVAVAAVSPLHEKLQTIAQQCASCTRCGLHKSRIQTVVSDGNPQARLMIIGEGPGQNEDETGIPFVGKAGQLLTKMLESVGLNRAEDTYIANIVKCRPPQNRTPTPEEMAACLPHLRAQINLVQPRLIVLAGGTAVKGLIGNIGGITRVRGTWRTWQGIPCMPIFHPSYLLRNESRAVGSPKWETWQDLKAIYARYQALDQPS